MNRANNLSDQELLYFLQKEDIKAVLMDKFHMNEEEADKTMTPDFLRSVTNGLESGLNWYEVAYIACGEALDQA